ncbi:2Fe-2S iron-sulfur cluster-binding protein [Leptothoe spongobia]|uniref:(2Fe-2S)-binding protein n=1 Tax=Leptothoe spongobia TAU-MAC 1115 TaxID=1967444 RepID=A0A947DE12_9CYAN|nr:2Fe-2S iron-sulfur cluster-binding protein [Leptothoe spongobia]MBT9315140.1 (2Fe-2S)-binding protein [Leptothoe spongobia TAU-MAC 1115]
MPKVIAQGKTFECEVGANLRRVLLGNDIALYNGKARLINCRGLGSCGTCAVMIDGEVSSPNWRDRGRRSLPPHVPERPLRLACQTRVLGEITVTKYDQFWGQGQNIIW